MNFKDLNNNNDVEIAPEVISSNSVTDKFHGVKFDCNLPLKDRCEFISRKINDVSVYCENKDRMEDTELHGYSTEEEYFVFFGPDLKSGSESYNHFMGWLIDVYFYSEISRDFQLPIILYLEQKYSYEAVRSRFFIEPFQENRNMYDNSHSSELLEHWGPYENIPNLGGYHELAELDTTPIWH